MADTRQLITLQRVNSTGGVDNYYPKTVASQVFIQGDESTTLQDHVTNTNIHVSAEERSALNAINNANGFLKLDAQGFVPSGNINPAILAITTEFADITALLAASTTAVAEGQLVMVTDASADSTVSTASSWAIYRRKVGTAVLNTLDSWQKIAEQESIDVTTTWASIQGKPSSTVADIDDAVTKKHEHANKTVLDGFTDTGSAQAPVLKYGAETVAFESNVSQFVVSTAADPVNVSTLKENDFIFNVTGTLA